MAGCVTRAQNAPVTEIREAAGDALATQQALNEELAAELARTRERVERLETERQAQLDTPIGSEGTD